MNRLFQKKLYRIAGAFSLFFVLHTAGIAQPSKTTMDVKVEFDKPNPFTHETQPEYPGGFAEMDAYLSKIPYPVAAKEAGVTGLVLVSFLIDSTGHIQQAKVLKGIGYGCDEEALRSVQAMPNWKPATNNGKAVETKFALPVRFPFRK